MKRFLMTVGAGTVAAVCVLVAVFVWIASEGRQLDVSSRDYVGRVLDTTLRHWDRSAIRAEASDELISAVPDDRLELLLATFSDRLGPIQSHGAPKGEAHVRVVPFQKVVMAEYLTPVTFEKATGHVALRLIQKAGRWRLLAVNVNSDALMR